MKDSINKSVDINGKINEVIVDINNKKIKDIVIQIEDFK